MSQGNLTIINRDHEIIREPRVADEAQVSRKFFADAAGQRDEAERAFAGEGRAVLPDSLQDSE